MSSSISLSILIPVYNWDISPLLEKLSGQCDKAGVQERVEIRVIDDGSSEKFDNAASAEQFTLVMYQEFSVNRGRVAVRNELLGHARGEYILLLDADMLPDHDGFIEKYLSMARDKYEIVCGGISYLQVTEANASNASFYLYKSGKTEALPAETRNRTPWRYLFTSNVMLSRDVIHSIRFDSRFSGYGYEDIEWAIRLVKTHTVKHIDNSCTHMGVMDKQQVYKKMRESIENYVLLLSLHPKETGHGGAAGLAAKLAVFPLPLLSFTDGILRNLFSCLPWNFLLFLVFQCNKAVLLARALKEKETV